MRCCWQVLWWLTLSAVPVLSEGWLSHLWSAAETPQPAVAARAATSSLLATKSSELEGFEESLLVEMRRRGRTSTCWKDAVAQLESKCRVVLSDEDTRSRLALSFTSCQLHQDGKTGSSSRDALSCGANDLVAECVSALGDRYYAIYVQFRLHVDTLCFHAQEELFQERTEVAVALLDRASSSSLSRMSALSKTSEEVVSTLQDARQVQDEVLAQAKHTGAWVLQQYTAQQEALVFVASRMEETSSRVLLLRDAFTDATNDQRVAMDSFRGEVSLLLTLQQAASNATRELEATLTSLLHESHDQLKHHRDLVMGVSAQTMQLSEAAAEQQRRFFQSHSAVVDLLDEVLNMQRAISSSTALVESVCYFAAQSLASIVLTMPPQTAAARFLCVLLVCGGCVLEIFAAVPHDAVGSLRKVCSGLIACVIIRAVCTYQTPEALQRRVIQEELGLWLARAQSVAEDGWQQWHSADTYGDVWTPATTATVVEVVAPIAATKPRRKPL